jgi:hypothetical protein
MGAMRRPQKNPQERICAAKKKEDTLVLMVLFSSFGVCLVSSFTEMDVDP